MMQRLLLRPQLAFAVGAASVKARPLIAAPKKRMGGFRTLATVVDVGVGLSTFDQFIN